ncbi:esterase [Methylobacterium currus]|uniref:Esterase n=1 Tax=Methylobacterium currus TaxID=2051553 RepID=A0A2R4WP16_9HYPH|nr:esterase [Methylobacterium currus]AWB23297.1 esterase [Methylobacterium currus]
MQGMMRALAAVALCTIPLAARAEYRVREVGSFHIGGHEVVLEGLPTSQISFTAGMAPITVDPNGQFETGQMYVQYVKLAEPSAPLPILLWHGGGLSGVTWETKPDGKPGWQQFFLERGYDTYVSDAVERGRASWSRYPEIYTSPPLFRTKREGWDIFRIGPADGWAQEPSARHAFEGTQFPISDYDQFAKQAVPRWATNDAATQAAYDAYVRKVCPCVIVVHSQGGNFGYTAALHNPDLVKALVLVEPSGAPDPAKADASAVKGIPHLVVWGDYLDRVPFWTPLMKANAAWRDAVNKAGGHVEWLELPKAGLHGNTHMLMMDRNSDAIAARVSDWLGQQKLTR